MYKKDMMYYKKAFFTAMLLSAIVFLPFVLIDGGYFVFYGDYNAQQIPFYTLCHDAIRNGEIMWNWQTDLGANFIGSYSFYTLGSPFFWLTIPFPTEVVPYLMAPLLILKISCCSLFAFAYIRRFVRKPQAALIGGLLYAFSSFSMYNVFFNHFHEAMVVFPLLLIALEELVVNKRKVFFALMVALNAFVNYFFFAGSCVFLIFYFICRCFDKNFHVDFKVVLTIAFEAIMGLALAGVMFIPAIITCLDVPRSSNPLLGWNMVFHNPSQRYGLIFQSLFFPADIAARQNFFPDTSARWSSVAAYLPLFSMSGVIAFIRFKKGHWAKKLMPLMLLCALIPVLNSAFVMFNSSFYTRWFYMPILIACFMTAYALERIDIDMIYGLKWCAFAVFLISMVGVLPSNQDVSTVNPETGESTTSQVMQFFKLPNEKLAFWISVVLAIVGIVVCWYLVRNKHKKNVNAFLNKSFNFVCIAILVFSYYTIAYGRIIGPERGVYNEMKDTQIDLHDDESFYRVEIYGEINNANMFWDMYGSRSFHSILPGSAFEFYKGVGFDRSVNTDPDGSYYALRTLTSTKYLIIPISKSENNDTTTLLSNMKNFEYQETQGNYKIYLNTAYVPMGCSYDYYVNSADFENSSVSNRDNLLVKAVYLTDEQIEKYSDIISEIPVENLSNYGYDNFVKDAQSLAQTTITDFTAISNGFTAKSNFETDRLVVFSVPYETGWTATVNGEPVDVEKVNNGLMAIKVSAGECDIEFSYFTPGLKYGIIATICSALILIIYYIVNKKVFKYKANPEAHLYFEEQLSSIRTHNNYIRTATTLKPMIHSGDYSDIANPDDLALLKKLESEDEDLALDSKTDNKQDNKNNTKESD